MSQTHSTAIRVAAGGRIVIPASFRKALDLRTGDEVVLQLEEGVIRIVSRAEALRRLQKQVATAVPRKVSLAGELIKERREEARRE